MPHVSASHRDHSPSRDERRSTRAAVSRSRICPSVPLLPGLTSMPIGAVPGTSSRSNSRRLGPQQAREQREAREVATGARQALHHPSSTGSGANREDDRDGPSSMLGRRITGSGPPVATMTSTLRATRSAANAPSRSFFALGPTVFDRDILSFDEARLAQTLMKAASRCFHWPPLVVEKADHGHGLGLARERPDGHAPPGSRKCGQGFQEHVRRSIIRSLSRETTGSHAEGGRG